jgi:cell pole-organizing protein PopZ
MEEILASIRQIISEDGELPPSAPAGSNSAAGEAAPRPQPPSADAAEPAETLDMTFEPAQSPPTIEARSAFRERPAQLQGDFERPAPDYAARMRPAPAALARRTPAEEKPLLSPEKGAAVSGAFGALARTMLEQNSRTLEDVVTEMLQPMLRSWLDDNLPSLVERMVKEEIERVSRGRR